MSKAYEFLKECGYFFVLTINGDYPAGRPFGAVMEVGDFLYLSTNDMNQAHKQMRENEKIQIVAKKSDTRDWIRITGIAEECDDKELKQRMLEECPVLQFTIKEGYYPCWIEITRIDNEIHMNTSLRMRKAGKQNDGKYYPFRIGENSIVLRDTPSQNQ